MGVRASHLSPTWTHPKNWRGRRLGPRRWAAQSDDDGAAMTRDVGRPVAAGQRERRTEHRKGGLRQRGWGFVFDFWFVFVLVWLF